MARPRRVAGSGRPQPCASGSPCSVGPCGARATRPDAACPHTTAGAGRSKGLRPRRGHSAVHPTAASEFQGRTHGGPRAATVPTAGGRPRHVVGASSRAPGRRRLRNTSFLRPAATPDPRRAAWWHRAHAHDFKWTPGPVQHQHLRRHRATSHASPLSGQRRGARRGLSASADRRAITPKTALQARLHGMRDATARRTGRRPRKLMCPACWIRGAHWRKIMAHSSGQAGARRRQKLSSFRNPRNPGGCSYRVPLIPQEQAYAKHGSREIQVAAAGGCPNSAASYPSGGGRRGLQERGRDSGSSPRRSEQGVLRR